MTGQMSLERSELNKKYGFFKLLSIGCMSIYIASLYVIAFSQYKVISDMLFLMSIGFALLNFLISKENFRADYTFFSLMLFVCYAALTTFWVTSDTEVFGFIYTLIRLFGLYVLVRMNIQDEKDFSIILGAIYWGTFAMCIYTIFFYGPVEIFTRIMAGHRIGQEINQVNSMGLFCTLLNSMTLYYVMYEKKYAYFFVLPVSLFVMLGAGSRKSFLLMALALLLLFMFKSKKGVALRFMAVASVLLIALYLVLTFADKESNYFLFRIAQVFEIFKDEEVSTLSDISLVDRKGMIEYGIELWKENPIFGYGSKQYEHFYYLLRGLRRPPHCTYIQVLVGYGLIGFGLFYGIYVFVFAKLVPMLKRRRRYSVLMLTFAIIFLANDFGGNMLDNKFLYMFLAIHAAYIAIKLDSEKEAELSEDTYSSPEVSYQPDTDLQGADRGRT